MQVHPQFTPAQNDGALASDSHWPVNADQSTVYLHTVVSLAEIATNHGSPSTIHSVLRMLSKSFGVSEGSVATPNNIFFFKETVSIIS